jgi:hypothetical protein
MESVGQSPSKREVMTAWQRRAALAMLLGLAALVNVAFNYAGPSFGPSDWILIMASRVRERPS